MSPTATQQADAYAELVAEVTAQAVADASAGIEFDAAYAARWDLALRRMQRDDPERWGRVRRAASAYVSYKPDPTLTRHERRKLRRDMRTKGRR